jgi:hypothetical protein
LVIVLAMAKSKFDREMAPLLGNAAEMRHEIFVGQ